MALRQPKIEDEIKHATQIDQQIILLRTSINDLTNLIHQLNDRLEPVLLCVNIPNNEKTKAGVSGDALVPLAVVINVEITKIQATKLTVEDILSRLQL